MSNPAWDDLPTLGKRLNRLIKYSETMLKKTDSEDHDGKNRYISTIVSLTRQQLDIIKTVDTYDEINNYFSILKKDELAIDKHTMRMKEKNRQIQNQKMEYEIEEQKQWTQKDYDRVKKEGEIEEEKSVRQQMKKKSKERL